MFEILVLRKFPRFYWETIKYMLSDWFDFLKLDILCLGICLEVHLSNLV